MLDLTNICLPLPFSVILYRKKYYCQSRAKCFKGLFYVQLLFHSANREMYHVQVSFESPKTNKKSRDSDARSVLPD